jgi:poly-gamma-glutamate synthesis protein (capsule biosynthesis protein)
MSDDISIVAAGDYMPNQRVERAMAQLACPADLLGPAAEWFRKADLAVVNLEYPLTRAETKRTTTSVNRKGDPTTLAVLKQAGVGLVTLANNHILDFGQQGLADTLALCARENVAVVGAGPTLQQARQPYHVTIKGRRIAVLGMCENEFSQASAAAGGAFGLDLIAAYHAIHQAKQSADIVIVLFHGGSEFTHYPRPEMVRTCRFFADVGASAVVCHHPHYVQGCETYHGVPILYSLGTLLYTGMDDPGILEVPIARLDFSAGDLKCSVHIDFCRISLEDTRLVELSPAEQDAARARFQGYCDVLQSPEALLAEWAKYCAEHRNYYLFHLLAFPSRLFRVMRRFRMGRLLRAWTRCKSRELLILENLVRCESHREAVLHILEQEHRR